MADCIIELFEGRIGGGKSYSAVDRMISHIARGGIVYSNQVLLREGVIRCLQKRYGVTLDDEGFAYHYRHLTGDQVALFHRHIVVGVDALVFLDEAQLWFNARDWAKTNRELLTFLTQARKYKCNIIFATQHIGNIDKQFGRLVQYIWRFRDMQKYRIDGLGIMWPFPQILQICLDGQDGRTIQRRRFVTKSQLIFDSYESSALFVDLHLDSLDSPHISRVQKHRDPYRYFGYAAAVCASIPFIDILLL